MKILKLVGRQVFDSRGFPTVEAVLKTSKGFFTGIAPSGVSIGMHEALELRDGGRAFRGKGALKAVASVNVIGRKLAGKNLEAEEIDHFVLSLDDTVQKSRIGGNAAIAVSIAARKAGAGELGIPLYAYLAKSFGLKAKKFVLPVPCFNIINGGKHAANSLDFQEYMLLPLKAKSFSEAMQIGVEVYHELKELIAKKLGWKSVCIGDEGGFSPKLSCFEEPLDFILEAAGNLGYEKKIVLAVDAAATSFHRNNNYEVEGRSMPAGGLLELWLKLVKNYPVASIEDPFHEEAFDDFALLNKSIGRKVQIVGDDLLTTNPERIKMAVQHKSCNCLLLKPNQIGTVDETFEAARTAFAAGWNVMASHRSGETEDSFIADLAVGISCGQIKAGAPVRERNIKYNRLLAIESELGKKTVYGGRLWKK